MVIEVNTMEVYITYYWNKRTRELHIFRIEKDLELAKRKFRRIDLPKFIKKITDSQYKMQLQKVIMSDEQYTEIMSYSNSKTDFKNQNTDLIKICEKIFYKNGFEVTDIYTTCGGYDEYETVYYYCESCLGKDAEICDAYDDAEYQLKENMRIYYEEIRKHIAVTYR